MPSKSKKRNKNKSSDDSGNKSDKIESPDGILKEAHKLYSKSEDNQNDSITKLNAEIMKEVLAKKWENMDLKEAKLKK